MLWKYGMVDDRPLLCSQRDSFRRTAKYFNKEAMDGLVLPVGARPWNCSRSLNAKLLPPERWKDTSGVIEIPNNVYLSEKSSTTNEFGAYYYAWYIEPKTGLLF